MEKEDLIIKRVFINTFGDPNIGIFPNHFEISGDPLIDLECFPEEDQIPFLKDVKEEILKTFEMISGEPCEVFFDFERK